MDSLVGIVDELTPIFACLQDKREQDELMSYVNKYLYVPQCQNFIMNNVRNLKDGNTDELRQIYQELMQKGESDLANKVNNLVSGDTSISEELSITLESYFKSAQFYRDVENNLLVSHL